MIRAIFFGFIILFSGPVNAQNIPSDAVTVKFTGPMKFFVDNFQKAVLAHDQKLVMEMMHPDYVKEQHDSFLEGRTGQFLTEFFGCNLDQVKKFNQLIGYTRMYDNKIHFHVVFQTVSKNKKRFENHYNICFRNDDSGYEFGMIGAVG